MSVDTRRIPVQVVHLPSDTRRQPNSTYRLQFTPDFTFDAATAILPYLERLGITDVYCSPILQAAPGSRHGYDVVDHTKVSQELGGRTGFERLADSAHARGMGIVVDVVPNHMAVPTPLYLNKALWSVLHLGADSPFAGWFDIDLNETHDGLLMPVLPGRIGQVVAKGQITVEQQVVPGFESEGPQYVIRYGPHVFPIRAQTEALPLAEMLDRQFYRLAYWKVAEEELNYRRFFDVDTLAAIRVERKDVFQKSHALLLELFRSGYIDGFRIDHPDGLADPRQYLARLHRATGGAWIAVEKIVADGEDLPQDWRCSGTTGYDASWRIGALFTDPTGVARLFGQYVELSGTTVPLRAIERESKEFVLASTLHAEMERLTDLLVSVCHADVRLRDYTRRSLTEALTALIVEMDRYRAYVVPRERPAQSSEQAIEDAARRAFARLDTDARDALRVVVDMALGREVGSAGRTYEEARSEFIVRFQQTCGATFAKGVEDTAFYRYTPLTSANEVGSDPLKAAMLADDVTAWVQRTASLWPVTMVTLSTHDSKRGEDTRAAIGTLTEWAHEWRDLVAAMREILRPNAAGEVDGEIENLMWQAIIGTWTDNGPIEYDRLHRYLIKAAREQKTWTTWTAVNDKAEHVLLDYAHAALANPDVHGMLEDFYRKTSESRRVATLGQKALALTLLGVADTYQGEETTRNSLVDPDNRRPVDFASLEAKLYELDARETAPDRANLAEEKLWITSRILRLRRERPATFASASAGFAPLPVTTGHAYAFVRTCNNRPDAAVVVERLPRALADTGGFGYHTLVIPDGVWRDILTGRIVHGGTVELAGLLDVFPVAVLQREQ